MPCLVFQRTFLCILHENPGSIGFISVTWFLQAWYMYTKNNQCNKKKLLTNREVKVLAHFTCPVPTTVHDHIELSNPWYRKIIKDKEFLHLACKESERTPSFHLKNSSTNDIQYILLCVGCDCNFKRLLNAAGKQTIMCLAHDLFAY